MHSVPILPLLVSAVAAWVFGAGYYGVLGRKWLAAQGKTMEQCQAENAGRSGVSKAAPFVLSFVAEVLMAGILYGVILHIGTWTVQAGVITGALCWLGFVLTTILVNNAYTFRRPLLTTIDSLHWLGVLAIMGAILGAMGG
jgi:Protein of unknown function (DUF1761)